MERKYFKKILSIITAVAVVAVMTPGGMFVAKADPCEHTNAQAKTTKNATCTEVGILQACSYCPDCEQYLTGEVGSYAIIGADELSDYVAPKLDHTFDQEVATEGFLKEAANHEHAAVYYLSCTCGESSKDDNKTFSSGEAVAHTYDQEVVDAKYLKSPADCTHKAAYYKSCECGASSEGTASEATFENGNPNGHTMDAAEGHAATSADCKTDKNGNSKYWYCTTCKKYFEDAAGTEEYEENEWVIPYKHTLTHTNARAATCDAEGNIEYWNCTKCGRYFSDEACTKEITVADTVLSKHVLKKVNAQASTCTAEGHLEYWECEDCDKIFKDALGTEEISDIKMITTVMLDHSFKKAGAHTAAVKETCTKDGNSEYWKCDECGHYFSDAEGKTEIEENSWVITAHHNASHVKAVEPTCTEEGNKSYYYCDWCKKYFKERACTNEINVKNKAQYEEFIVEYATGHNIEPVDAVAATCLTDGYKAYYHCTKCGEKFKDAEGKQELTDAVFESDYVVHAAHDFEKVSKEEATCYEEGVAVDCQQCKVCHKYYDMDGETQLSEEEVIAPKKHTIGSLVKETPASCTKEGTRAHYVCEECGQWFDINVNEVDSKSLIIPCHDGHLIAYAAKEATYTEEGQIKYWECEKCGKCFSNKTTLKEINEEDTVIPKVALEVPKVTSADLKTSNSVTIKWNESKDADGYVVYYKKGDSENWAKKNAKDNTSLTISGLSVNTKYQFRVKAYYKDDNGTAYSGYKGTKAVKTLKKLAAPKVTNSGTKVKVKWTKLDGASGYEISQATSKNGTKKVATVTSKSTVSKLIKATKGKTYYYKVRAYKTVDGERVYASWSNAVKFVRK